MRLVNAWVSNIHSTPDGPVDLLLMLLDEEVCFCCRRRVVCDILCCFMLLSCLCGMRLCLPSAICTFQRLCATCVLIQSFVVVHIGDYVSTF